MRAARLVLAAFFAATTAAAAKPPDWDPATVSPACPWCEATLSWGGTLCYSCQGRVEWALPPAPRTAEEAWRYAVAAISQRDREFLAVLVEGDAAENERRLAIAPLMRFASAAPAGDGQRVVVRAMDRATVMVLAWSGGKFRKEWEAHWPLRNQGEAVKAMRAAAAAEKRLRAEDLDGNGQEDYWTGDWSGLARLAGPDGSAVALLPEGAGAADLRPLAASAPGAQRPRLLDAAPSAPWNGYRFAALELDEAGQPLASDGPDPDSDPHEHASKFAFIAVPAEPGVTGYASLVLCEDGRVWAREFAGAADPAPGALFPEDAVAIADAIRGLDAEDAVARDAAQGKLLSFGRRARPSIETALKTASPEARHRLRLVLEDLDTASPDLRAWPAKSKDLLDAGWQQF